MIAWLVFIIKYISIQEWLRWFPFRIFIDTVAWAHIYNRIAFMFRFLLIFTQFLDKKIIFNLQLKGYCFIFSFFSLNFLHRFALRTLFGLTKKFAIRCSKNTISINIILIFIDFQQNTSVIDNFKQLQSYRLIL